MAHESNHASSSKYSHRTQAYEASETEDAFSDLPEPLVLPPADLLSNYETINVLAPLVRCSKLPFRHLCSLYETHITHTPMILAQEFSRSQTARISDFSTSVNERGVFWVEPRATSGTKDKQKEREDEHEHEHKSYQTPQRHNRLPPSPTPPTPKSELVRGLLLAQFASPNAASLADAAELIAPYVDGLDVNCGCPQKWAFHEGIGCALLRKPELVADMIRATKDRMGWGWPVSIKIRIDPEEQ
jgi:tRNA-dihydrouridine synthase 4